MILMVLIKNRIVAILLNARQYDLPGTDQLMIDLHMYLNCAAQSFGLMSFQENNYALLRHV